MTTNWNLQTKSGNGQVYYFLIDDNFSFLIDDNYKLIIEGNLGITWNLQTKN